MGPTRQFAAMIQKNPLVLQVVFGDSVKVRDITSAIKDMPNGPDRKESIFRSPGRNLLYITLKGNTFEDYYDFRLDLEKSLAKARIFRTNFKLGITLPGKDQSAAWDELNGLIEDSTIESTRQPSLFRLEDTLSE